MKYSVSLAHRGDSDDHVPRFRVTGVCTGEQGDFFFGEYKLIPEYCPSKDDLSLLDTDVL